MREPASAGLTLRMQLLVFDLDGTLVDSSQDLADSINALLADYDVAPLPADVVASMVGDGAAVLVRRALVRSGVKPDPREALERFLAHYDVRLLATTKPYAGMVETLEAVRSRHRLAVLTNKPLAASVRLLDGLGLSPFFAEVIGGDTVHGRKPDPSGLLSLIAGANATPETTLLVGDSPVDLETARRASTRICLARYGFGFRFGDDGPPGPASDVAFIDHPQGILDVLARVNGHT
jgi:phosphoglycolate phosphatase